MKSFLGYNKNLTYAGQPSPVAEEKRVTKAIPRWLKFQSISVHSLSTCYENTEKLKKYYS